MQTSKKFIIEDKQGNNMYPATFADVVYTEDGGNVAEKLKQIEGATPSVHTHTKSQITDFAHTHTKSEISDFPTSLPANGGNADTVGGIIPGEFARKTGVYEELVSGATRVLDTRDTNQPPSWYFKNKKRGVVNEFKNCATIGLSDSAMYCMLQTIAMWDDSSAGKINQIAYRSGRTPMIRFSNDNDAWEAWQPLSSNTGVVKSVQQGRHECSTGNSTITINISNINPAKSIVLLDGYYRYDGAVGLVAPIINFVRNNNFVVSSPYLGYTSSTGVAFSWQVIEFY